MTAAPPAPDTQDHHEVGAAAVLRGGLLLLAALGAIGTTVELAMLRHWKSPSQLIPWVALAGVGIAIVAVAVRPTRSTVLAARAVGLALAACGIYGVIKHTTSNYEAGPLDAVYGARWDSLSALSQWWHAATGTVGPSPTLAPLVLTQIALCLLLVTIHHPALHPSLYPDLPARPQLVAGP